MRNRFPVSQETSKKEKGYNGIFKINNISYPEYSKTEIINYSTESQILVVHSYPGQDYSLSLKNTKAILFKTYHSATLNTANEKFIDFCKKAKEMNVPMFVSGSESDTNYESTKSYNDLNINILPYGTFISTYMKLWADLSKL